MKRLKESPNPERWPRCKVESLECRKKDLVIRIADWTKDKDAPYYDVEFYIGGIYDWNESKSFSAEFGKLPAKNRILEYVTNQINNLL